MKFLEEIFSSFEYEERKKRIMKEQEVLNEGYILKLSNGENYYITDEQYFDLQEEINLNNKTFNFVSKYDEKLGNETNEIIEYTIFINQIVSIFKQRKVEN